MCGWQPGWQPGWQAGRPGGGGRWRGGGGAHVPGPRTWPGPDPQPHPGNKTNISGPALAAAPHLAAPPPRRPCCAPLRHRCCAPVRHHAGPPPARRLHQRPRRAGAPLRAAGERRSSRPCLPRTFNGTSSVLGLGRRLTPVGCCAGWTTARVRVARRARQRPVRESAAAVRRAALGLAGCERVLGLDAGQTAFRGRPVKASARVRLPTVRPGLRAPAGQGAAGWAQSTGPDC